MGSFIGKKTTAAVVPEIKKEQAAQEQRVAEQQTKIDRQESELAGRTSASLRARRRGGGRAMLLGGEDSQSTLG